MRWRAWRHGRLRLAGALASGSLLLAVVEMGIYLTHPPHPANHAIATVELWQYVLQGSSMAVAGFVLLARRSARVLGWLLLSATFPFMVAACLSTWLRGAVVVTPGVSFAVYAEAVLWDLPRVLFALLGLYFPTGTLPGRWARPVAVGLVGAILVNEVTDWVSLPHWHPGGVPMANAFYIPALVPLAGQVGQVATLAVWLGVLTAALSPLTRWRRADRVVRRQIALALPGFLLFLIVAGLRQRYWSGWVAGATFALSALWPAAIGYVIVRGRLYMLDLAARRIVAGAVPVALLAIVYTAAALVMSLALPGSGAALAAVLAVLAALVGLVLRPIGGWVARRLDRRLYGDRAEPYQLARVLAARLRDGVDAARIPAEVCQIVVTALRLPGAALAATSGELLASVGALGPAPEPVELRYQGRAVGRLLVAPRLGQESLDELDLAALQPLVDLAGPAVSALSARTEWEARLAAVREEERRRLRHDVHDGVGPSLAAIRLRIDTAMALLPPGSPGALLLADVPEELRDVVEEVRRIAANQQPPAVERLGLPAALAELADRLSSPALRIELHLPDHVPALPATVAVAAYRIAAEALNNTVRHSAATRGRLRLAVAGDRLTLRVVDNGNGIRAGAGGGLGLRSMAGRARALGGTCQIRSGALGTALTARLPVTPTRRERKPAAPRVAGVAAGTAWS